MILFLAVGEADECRVQTLSASLHESKLKHVNGLTLRSEFEGLMMFLPPLIHLWASKRKSSAPTSLHLTLDQIVVCPQREEIFQESRHFPSPFSPTNSVLLVLVLLLVSF